MAFERILYLVKWGFSREEAYLIPIPELQVHIRNINKYYEQKNKAAEGADNTPSSSEPKYAGNTVM